MGTRVVAPVKEPAYKVLSSLSEGAIAEVDVVRHDVFPKDRVRKRVDLFGIDEAIGLLEPQLLEDIEHRNIVKVHEARFDRDLPGTKPLVFFMDYYPERSVYTAFQDGHAFPILDALRIAKDVLSALQYVHEVRRFVHRDVKPSNILLAEARTKGLLADFGQAAAIGDDGKVAASGGSVLYRAPEWASRRVAPAADIYSLGLVLHEMLSGPFDYAQYDGDEASERIRRGWRAIPDRDLASAPYVPERLRRIVSRSVHRDPTRRYGRAADFRDALMTSRVIGWRRTADGWEGPDSGTACMYRVIEEPKGSARRLSVVRKVLPTGPWRRFGIPDRDVVPDDRGAYAAFFAETLALAFQRRAT